MAQPLLLTHGVGSPGDLPFYFPSRFPFLTVFVFSWNLLGGEKKHLTQQAGSGLAEISFNTTRPRLPVSPALEELAFLIS
jgi:hypothetical protein